MLQQTRALIALRRREPALRLGASRVRWAEGEVLVLQRGEGPGAVLAVFNLGAQPASLPAWLPELLDAAHGLWAHPAPRCTGLAWPAGAAAFYRLTGHGT
ncbi:MAG: DUF3459 domain-containing protein [Burkholderiales bacterium]|nr:DUF3459 domain-containing protein [Burkholderiales bacterium]